jgi:hypothetical protein
MANKLTTKYIEQLVNKLSEKLELDDESLKEINDTVSLVMNDFYKEVTKQSKKPVITKNKNVKNVKKETKKGNKSKNEDESTVKEDESNVTEKKKRQMSSYTFYVKEQMKTEEVKNIPHKERMKFIGDKWKTVDEKTKIEINEKVKKLNEEESSST